jgi:hypothetical protein
MAARNLGATARSQAILTGSQAILTRSQAILAGSQAILAAIRARFEPAQQASAKTALNRVSRLTPAR